MNEITFDSVRHGLVQYEGEQPSYIATIDGIQMSVPLDPANRHYAAILDWVAKGNTIQPADSVE